MEPRILVASPVRQNPFILAYFLFSLRSLEKKGLEVDFYFIDDNIEEQSKKLLTLFQSQEARVEMIQSDDQKDGETQDGMEKEGRIQKRARMKDDIINYALQREYDGLFLIDSDIMVDPYVLIRLWYEEYEIISNIVWTQEQEEAEWLPQVWMKDRDKLYEKLSVKREGTAKDQKRTANFLKKMKEPDVYEVDGLGACTLIRREALLKGVKFNPSVYEEDQHFCIRATALNIPLFVDTRVPAYHIYRTSDLKGAETFKQEIMEQKKKAITISLCMIVKSEEQVLARCLSSIQEIVDEIIIVDTGSTDRTKEIAASYTKAIYNFEWSDDFSEARNFSFSKATKDYILWLDADDVLEKDEHEKFMMLKNELQRKDIDSVMMDYHVAFDENGRPTSSLKRNRLIKRSRQFRWVGAVHEYLAVHGRVIQSDIAITHRKEKPHTDRNLQIYRRRDERGEHFSPRDVYYFGNELKDHGLYEEAIEKYEKFLAMKKGWVEDKIAACLKLSDCYQMLNNIEKQVQFLFHSMSFDVPRAECLCRLGALFLSRKRYEPAIYWYEQATKLKNKPTQGSLMEHAAWTWLPYIQLAVCYDRLDHYHKANECNEQAFQYDPTNPLIRQNKVYFRNKLSQEQGNEP